MINRSRSKFVILRASDKDSRRTTTSTYAPTFRVKLRRLIAPLVAIVLLAVLPLLAQQQSDRAKQIGGKFQCMCSCNQILTQCNHVGCTVSTSMLKELGAMGNRGDSEAKITLTFVP